MVNDEEQRKLLSKTLDSVIRREVSCVADHLKNPKQVYYLAETPVKEKVEYFLRQYNPINAMEVEDLSLVDKHDVLFFVIQGEPTVANLEKAKEFEAKLAKLTGITDEIESSISSLSKDVLGIHVPNSEGVEETTYNKVFLEALETVLGVMQEKIDRSYS
ncbi:hypothetical protein ACEN4P_09800 [Marinilactibacillus psychrotolerans]|uniref:hypothetical protein n=1 Tax=Marinilactibacillus psychrotolerans TaxID=191770 RepID=UPI003884C9A2